MTIRTSFAPAKVNLSLHVTGKRADGYHLLDSLVAFADVGDRVSAVCADGLSLTVDGPRAAGVPVDGSNLVLRAAEWLAPERGAALTLEKHLPAAAGIGGGSSDAAAAVRVLCDLWGVPLPEAAETAVLGADVPICLAARARRMCGIGERLLDVPPLPELPVVLVNPGVDVPTGAVFGRLASAMNAPMPETPEAWGGIPEAVSWIGAQRNDLEPPALGAAPVIGDVLEALSPALLARMSGSGATCFGLCGTAAEARALADEIEAARPEWWVRAGVLG